MVLMILFSDNLATQKKLLKLILFSFKTVSVLQRGVGYVS